MANKAATASIIAAVGIVAVIGTIAAVTSSRKAAGHDGALPASIKLSTLCSSTLYPNRCEQSLSPVVNDTANPEDVLRAALKVALDEVAAALGRSAEIGKGVGDNMTTSAIGVCKKLLDDAVDDLKGMAGLRPDQVVNHVNDLRTWLSGVMTYIYTCADGFDKPELKEAMDTVLRNSTELSSNALAMITRVGEFLQGQGAKMNSSTGGSRRLLGWHIGDTPEVMESRRRLLAVNGKLDEIATVRDASRRLLSETLNEITEMSHVARRRLLGLDDLMFGDVSNVTDNGDFISFQRDNGDSIGRRLMSMSFNEASNTATDVEAGGKRRLLSLIFSSISDMTKEVDYIRRRLLSMSFNDASKGPEDDAGGRRRLLSVQIESIADMAAQINRHLLATELPDDLAGRRQLLSSSLTMLSDVATKARGQLEAIDNGTTLPGKPERMLTENVVGTVDDDIDYERDGVPAGVFPEWVSSKDRRLLQMPGLQKPNAVVAKDGSGNFKTITEAINAAPKKSTARFVIYVKAGDYNEYVTIPKDVPNVFMYGDGPTKTRVIGNKSNKDGIATIATRTFSAEGSGFICKSMGFVNTAGPDGHQAVALHVQGDMSAFFNCRFEGYQDTLYVHANRQFFRNCEVLGTIDFIFGNSAALFQNCLMTVRKPMDNQANMVTAHGRTDPNMPTGIVLQGCRVVPEQELFPVRLQVASYLGRPWKEYARTVVMESVIGDLIKPEGWAEWMGELGLKTLYYAEYANTGPGAGTSKRVTWPGYRVIGQAEATHYTAGVFIDGMTWLQNTGTPNVMGFIK